MREKSARKLPTNSDAPAIRTCGNVKWLARCLVYVFMGGWASVCIVIDFGDDPLDAFVDAVALQRRNRHHLKSETRAALWSKMGKNTDKIAI